MGNEQVDILNRIFGDIVFLKCNMKQPVRITACKYNKEQNILIR